MHHTMSVNKVLLISTELSISNQIAGAFSDVKEYRQSGVLKGIRLTSHMVFIIPYCETEKQLRDKLRIHHIIHYKFDRVVLYVSHNLIDSAYNRLYLNNLSSFEIVCPAFITIVTLPTVGNSQVKLTTMSKLHVWWNEIQFPANIRVIVAKENDAIDFDEITPEPLDMNELFVC